MGNIGYYNLRSCSDGPGTKATGGVMASFFFEQNMEYLFPYINAVAERAELYENPKLIRFVYKDVWCVIYPNLCILSPLADREQVRVYVRELAAYLTDIRDRRGTITPDPTPFRQVPVTRILGLLPKTNCRECGFRSCMAFAAMLSKQQTDPGNCPYMGAPAALTFPVTGPDGEQVSSVTLPVRKSPVDPPDPEPGHLPGPPEPVQGDLTQAGSVSQDLPDPLSPRELEVLSMMGEGLTNREISKELIISPHTVKSHVVHIFNKLGVNHRTQAVVWAARNGII